MKLNKSIYSIKCEIGACNSLSKWYFSFDGHGSECNLNICTECLKEIQTLTKKQFKDNKTKPEKTTIESNLPQQTELTN